MAVCVERGDDLEIYFLPQRGLLSPMERTSVIIKGLEANLERSTIAYIHCFSSLHNSELDQEPSTDYKSTAADLVSLRQTIPNMHLFSEQYLERIITNF